MKKGLKKIMADIEEMERKTKELENTDVLDLSKEGVYIELRDKTPSERVNEIKKSLFGK